MVEMSDVREVADHIYRIQVKIPRVFAASTIYFINDGNGVLVEPGPGATVPAIQQAMRDLGMNDLAFIIPTHTHMDHAGGCGTLCQMFPEAKVVVHPLGESRLVDPSRLIAGTKRVYGDDFQDYHGVILPVPQSQVMAISDGETFETGGRRLQARYAPGHSDDHIVIHDSRTNGLFCGEALGTRAKSAPTWAIPNAAPPHFDMAAYLGTSAKLAALNPDVLFYSHDGTLRNPAALIKSNTDSTKWFGNIIGPAVARGDSLDQILEKVQETAQRELGIGRHEIDFNITVQGFVRYFKTH